MCSLSLFTKTRSARASSQAGQQGWVSQWLLHTDLFATPASSHDVAFPAHNEWNFYSTISDTDFPEKQGRRPTHGGWWYAIPSAGPRRYPSKCCVVDPTRRLTKHLTASPEPPKPASIPQCVVVAKRNHVSFRGPQHC